MSFPVEIRLMIYRCLLHSWEIAIDLHSSCYSRRGQDGKISGRVRHKAGGSGFQTAILRCCRQVYTEAVAVLYSENCFDYEMHSHPDQGRDFPLQNLKLVRYLRVIIYENGVSHLEDMQDIADATLALRRGVGMLLHFRLVFSFNSCCSERSGIRERPLAIGVAFSSKILKGILALDVRQELEIVVLDNKASTRETFQNLADATAVAKSWHSLDEDGFYQDQGPDVNGDERFRCSWTLRPTSSAPPSAVAHFLCRNIWKGYSKPRAEAQAAQSTS